MLGISEHNFLGLIENDKRYKHYACQVKAMFKQRVNLMILTWIFAASNSFA